jgi:uncharacterized protein involved in exopolysaccharide biosynthesis
MSVEPADQELEDQAQGATSVTAKEWIDFIRGAARRHAALGAGIGAVIAVVGIVVSLILPAAYESSGKILVTQNAAVTDTLSNPSGTNPAVDPMRGVTEIVMRKENLEGIVRETNMIEQWAATRSAVYRLKDSLQATLFGPLTEADKMKALVAMLENQLVVRPEDTVSIRIRAMWRDPQMAFAIAKLAQKKFLDARGNQEKAPITAAIDILEDELKKAAEDIEPEFANVGHALQKARAPEKIPVLPSPSASAPPVMQYVRPQAAPRPAGPNPTLSAKLAEIRQHEREVQDPWQANLTAARLKLSELKGTYGPMHPSVVQQEARVRELAIEPPTLVNLRQEEHDLLAQIETGSLVGDTSAPGGRWVPRPMGLGAPSSPNAPMMVDENPEVAAARAKLMSAISKYSDVKDRLDAARIKLTTAETAFKFRYVTVADPEIPTKPVKPNRPVLILASIAAGLVAALLAGAVKELLSGRVIEPWQVKQIGLPLLAEVSLTDHTKS